MMDDKVRETDFELPGAEKHPHDQAEDPTSYEKSSLTPAAKAHERETNSPELLSPGEIEDFQARWHAIQMNFVDKPHSAVDEADTLTVEVIEHLTDHFAKKHDQLKAQWLDGDDHSTEDYRIGLQEYRAFFNQLLDVS